MSETASELATSDAAQAPPGRLPNGHFAPGNRLSPGRSPKAVEDKYHELTIAKCPAEKWAAIVEKAVAQAIEGDKDARAWVGRVLGLEKPDRDALVAGAAVEVRIVRASDWRVGAGDGGGEL